MNIATRHHFDVGANKHSPNDTGRGSGGVANAMVFGPPPCTIFDVGANKHSPNDAGRGSR